MNKKEVMEMLAIKRIFLVFLMFATLGVCGKADDGLVAYWPIDEGDGNIVNDKSGNGNIGHILGKVNWVNGPNGKVLLFDGASTYINCGNGASLNISDEITIEAYVKLTSRKGGGIVNKYFPSSGYYLTAAWRDHQKPAFYLKDSSGGTIIVGNELSIGEWHHLLVTAKLNGKMKIYLDGDLEQEKEIHNAFGNNTCNLLIGVYQSDYFDGNISEVKIYNRVIDTFSNKVIKETLKQKQEKIVSLENNFLPLKEKFSQSTANTNSDTIIFKQVFESKIHLLEDKIKNLKDIFPSLLKSELNDEFRKSDLQIKQLDKILSSFEKKEFSLKDFLVTVVPPISDTPIMPLDIFVPGNISNVIRFKACPGEYEPGSFVISAFSEISGLSIEPTDISSANSLIPAKNIDVKIIKCWYLPKSAWTDLKQDIKERTLFPDLLLNDDSLVRVDMMKHENYLKIMEQEAEKYIWISNPDEKIKYKQLTIEELPVKDSSSILPVNIEKGHNKQFWITIKIPEETPAGHYEGLLKLKKLNTVIREIEIRMEVLPFKLAPPYCTSSIYYPGKLDATGKGAISSEIKSELQLRKDFESMIAHGITNPICYQAYDEKLLNKYLDIKKDAGMNLSPFYYLETGICRILNNFKSEDSALLRERAGKIIASSKQHGISEIYFYGVDEAKGEKLTRQRSAWEIIHNIGGKIFVAGAKDVNRKAMGDIQDLLVCSGFLSREEASAWHSAGHKIWSYGNPQGGVKNPVTYRRNYGLLLWQYDYDGAATFAYQCTMGNGWNAFDTVRYRDHNFTYPTVDGVIDTIAYEGYREGIDDLRYLSTLINEIAKAKKEAVSGELQIVNDAEKFLAELKKADLNSIDFDNTRSKMAEYIIKLQKRNK